MISCSENLGSISFLFQLMKRLVIINEFTCILCRYKDDLKHGKISRSFDDFDGEFHAMLKDAENEAKKEAKAQR